MTTIEIDFDVFKALTGRRESEKDSYNDVLRRMLGLKQPIEGRPPIIRPPSNGDWVTKGFNFPAGTEFRATHKGRTYTARVTAGALELNGQRFDSPSSAAGSITNNSVNGWIFWECRLPATSSWKLITTLRQ